MSLIDVFTQPFQPLAAIAAFGTAAFITIMLAAALDVGEEPEL